MTTRPLPTADAFAHKSAHYPGTEYTVTAKSNTSAVSAPGGPGASYTAIGYTHPGWNFYWNSGDFTYTATRLSEASTIQYDGLVYSLVHLSPEINASTGFMMTAPWGGDMTANLTSRFEMNITSGQNVAPVPEPETYAMMLAGLGLLGVVARRRRQKTAA